MTIMATCLSITLGAWRLRLRFDIDEPRETPVSALPRAPRFLDRDLHSRRRQYHTGGNR